MLGILGHTSLSVDTVGIFIDKSRGLGSLDFFGYLVELAGTAISVVTSRDLCGLFKLSTAESLTDRLRRPPLRRPRGFCRPVVPLSFAVLVFWTAGNKGVCFVGFVRTTPMVELDEM